MYDYETVELQRDVNVVTIPDGTTDTLSQGEIVTIQQSQGGNYTVATERGYLVRIAGSDGDALGKNLVDVENVVSGTDPETVEKNVWEVLRTIYDPEIPVNIVELGLVYHCKVVATGEGQNKVDIEMTLTAPGCGMGPVLQGDVEIGVKKLPGVESVNVEVVFEPPWSYDMMSEVARVQLGMI